MANSNSQPDLEAIALKYFPHVQQKQGRTRCLAAMREALELPSVEAVTKECNFTVLGLWCDVHGYKECPCPRCVAIPTSRGA